MSVTVSIVLPVYNGEKYLAESLQSILDQTYPDWECIIVNDNSSDNTLNIARSYAEQDARFCIINNEENEKLPKSLNIGFQKANGRFFTWTSDDNRYKPIFLEKMVGYIKEHSEVDLLYTGFDVIDENGNFLRKSIAQTPDLLPICNIVGASFLFRRELFERIGGYDPNQFLIEDYEFWLRAYFNKFHFAALPWNLYEYREHDGSLTLKKQEQVHVKLKEMYERYFEQLWGYVANNPKREYLYKFYETCVLYRVKNKRINFTYMCLQRPEYLLRPDNLLHKIYHHTIHRFLKKRNKQ